MVHLSLWSPGHLCHDPTRHLREFHPAFVEKYAFVTGAIKDLDLLIIGVFIMAALGLLSLRASELPLQEVPRCNGLPDDRLHDRFATGDLALEKVIETRVDSHGEEVPFRYESVAPGSFEGDPQLVLSIALCISAIVLMIGLERFGRHADADWMKRYGLIGRSLGHSHSPEIFRKASKSWVLVTPRLPSV